MSTAKILSVPEGLAFYTPYDPDMLDDFKARVPATDRRWDGQGKRWLVAVGQLPTLEQLCARHGLTVVKKLAAGYDVPKTVQKIIEVRYIGAPKLKNDGSMLASGYVNGDWTVVFPQDVLRAWFDGPTAAAPTAATTHYGLLGLRRGATEEEIKRSHRVMVKRWHPDVNRDPDAGEMMKKINLAYSVLANGKLRAKYDAGLALEATLQAPQMPPRYADTWRPPLRCGWLLVEGQERLGRLIVSKIAQWQDIVDGAGRVLVTSWPAGADKFQENWV